MEKQMKEIPGSGMTDFVLLGKAGDILLKPVADWP
jgi:hypothetical protein